MLLKKNKKLFILLTFFILACVSFCFSIFLANAEVDGVEYDFSAEFQDEYARGTLFDVPSCDVQIGNNTYATKHVLKYPDNRESEYVSNLLDVEGNYSVIYTYTQSGVEKTFKKDFSVYSSIASFFESKQASINVNKHLNSEIDAREDYVGVEINSKKVGTVVTYTKEIDLSDNTKDDTLLEFIANPLNVNIVEFTSFTVKLIDVNNEDNWIVIYVKQESFEKNAYLLWAGANFEYKFAGYDPYNAIGINRGNIGSGNGGITAGYVASNSEYTANSYGYSDTKIISSVKLAYDNNEKRIYCYPGINVPSLDNTYVADLDDTAVVGVGNEWGGFSSNKVKMTISTNLYSSSFSYLILNVDGLSMSDYKINDTTAPNIEIDMGKNTEIPFGIVNKPYKIFNTKITDNVDDIISEHTVSVISDKGKTCKIVDECFTPDSKGEYTIYYTAKDFAGNQSTASVKVNVLDDYGSDTLQFENDDCDGITVKIGERFVAPYQSSIGGSGFLNHSWVLCKNGIDIATDFDGYFFNETGNYLLKYLVSDYNGTEIEKDFNITVEGNLYPVFTLPYVSTNYIKGKTYYLPKVQAYDYSHNSNGETVELKVKVDGVDLGSDFKFIPTNTGNVSIVYYAVSKYDTAKVTEQTFTARIVEAREDTDNFLKDFFVTKNTEISFNGNEDSSPILFETSNNDNGFSFINPLNKYNFSVELNAIPYNFNANASSRNPNFDGVNVYLTDALNNNKKVKLTFKKLLGDDGLPIYGTSNSEFYINDKFISTVFGSFYDTANVISLYYDYKTTSFIDGVNASVGKITTYLDGTVFDGFKTDYLYVSFELINVVGKSQVYFLSISEQALTKKQKTDRMTPSIFLSNDIPTSLEVNINELVELPSAKAFDVLSPNPTLILTIKKPNGSILYSGSAENGYSFTPSVYGEYSIRYEANDGIAKKFTKLSTLRVVDKEKPTINISGDIVAVAKAGGKVSIPSYSFSDNVTTDLYHTVVVYYPDATFIDVTDKNSFNVGYAGIYKLIFYARDEKGNTCMKIFSISVVD